MSVKYNWGQSFTPAYSPIQLSFKSIESGRMLSFIENLALYSSSNFVSMCSLSLSIGSPFSCVANALKK